MNLEFELEEISNNTGRRVYTVKRKGLEVGLLWMDEPYNAKVALAKQLYLK